VSSHYLLTMQSGFEKFISVAMNSILILMKKVGHIFYLQQMKNISRILWMISFPKFKCFYKSSGIVIVQNSFLNVKSKINFFYYTYKELL
jgi:hypothetical protein